MSAGPRRAHGTGSLETRTDKYGREIYYGRFYVAGRQVKRKLGAKRRAGESTGLTKTGAERALQKLIDAEVRVVPMGERIDLKTAGERYLVHLEQVMHRRPTTTPSCCTSTSPRSSRDDRSSALTPSLSPITS
jgi:hypothetical protein